ncbi:TniQ family protein [Roseibium aggregatum]|uniref:TniQ family protein n=1 Tax=Roseibium aggregatum TaxID=187304 RepID=UPI0025AB9BF3|nr:TniQ family protein [Roseibium aggregatum]WJS00319.1 TniQ family protein [Roseibium aggregatum]
MKLDPFYVPTCHPDETLTSFVSRVAAMASRSARDFCLDMGLNFHALRDGDPYEVGAFAELAGFDDGRFPGAILERTGDRSFKMNAEPLPRASLRRSTVRVCPHCIKADLECSADHERVRPYGRWSWMIASVRTCSKHNTPLIVAATDDNPQMLHDFSLHLQPFAEDIDRHVAEARDRVPSDFETYVLSRIKGQPSKFWLSSLPVYAAARACEIIGATKIHGAQVMAETLSEDEWYDAGQAGFEITAHGPESIRAHLNDMQRAFMETRRAWGPKQIYGRLYEWLAHETGDTAYDALREIITEHAFNTLPMGPDDEIFGKRPVKRILHSIHSAHLETGAHPKRLRKVLQAVGLITEDQLTLSDERTLFRAEDAKFHLDRIEESMSLNRARDYINAPRPVERTLLAAGLLKPWLEGGNGVLKDHAFAKRDLDEFLAALTGDALPVTEEEKILVPILRAVKMANCSTSEVVQLILDRRLGTIRMDPDLTGFLAVLVDPEEVKSLVRREDHGGYSLREVEQKLNTTTQVIKALIEHNHLEAEIAVNPINRCPQTIVKRDVLTAFMDKFETASSLARRSGSHLQTMMKRLDGLGVPPAFPKDQIPATFYALDRVRLADPDLIPAP